MVSKIKLLLHVSMLFVGQMFAITKEDELVTAAGNGDLERVKQLIENEHVPIDARGGEQYFAMTPLMMASHMGQMPIVEYLVNKEASLTLQDDTGYTPLMTAAKRSHEQIVLFLLQHGAPADQQNQRGDTALLKIAANGSFKIAFLLISFGANINHCNKDGETPLKLARYQGNAEMIEWLEANGIIE